ncbi:Beta-fimbriae probable major subunit [Enterobacter hormaechei]|nr:Beta-fimbriae probable major subunit [Enterobacter hormaechei]
MANVTADGVKSDVISGTVDSPSWQKTATGIIKTPHEMMTVAASGTTAPLPFTTAVFPLKTSLAIQNTAALAITDDTNLDGQATITVKYL